MYFVILKSRVTLVGSMSLSCVCVTGKRAHSVTHAPKAIEDAELQDAYVRHTWTFFCVTKTTESFPRTPMLVTPADLTALNAYSA